MADEAPDEENGIIPAYAGSTRLGKVEETLKGDHPRIRGEHFVKYGIVPSHTGSSPHTRGAPRQSFRGVERPGIIPAYAGSTPPSCPWSCFGSDHPRIRGEHLIWWAAAPMTAGSSPHTRGAPPQRHHRRPESRIIPAYAGSTCPEDAYECFLEGSSPHTRGAPTDSRSPSGAGRIIPAYAGSTFTFSGLMVASADHPRIRGEHGCVRRVSCALAGSSPHTRGALVTSRVALPTEPDHPRIRGEHRRPPDRRVAQGGSSPHTRGARRRSRWRRRRGRIIPAYAGSTRSCSTTITPAEDHPRIRGEHSSTGFVMKSPTGSSPHTRGAPKRHRRHGRRRRDHPRIRGEHAVVYRV